jgi:hypothetical protein
MALDVQASSRVLLAVLGSRMVIEKAHERAVGHERHNALRFVVCGFEAANPAKYDNQP